MGCRGSVDLEDQIKVILIIRSFLNYCEGFFEH